MVPAMKLRHSFAYVKISIAIVLLAFYCTAAFHEVLGLCPRVGHDKCDRESDHDCAFCTLLRTPGVPASAIVVAVPVETETVTVVDLMDHVTVHHREISRQRAPPSIFIPG
jgi:hypothetical protein